MFCRLRISQFFRIQLCGAILSLGIYLNPNEISFYATHMFYDEGGIVSPFFKLLLPLINFIKPKSLIRIKGNFYPQTESLIEHGKHWDYDYEHQAAIFSLNTCDGFTRLDGGQKIGSVENRMLFLDATTLTG